MGIFIERLGYFSRELFVGISFSLVSDIVVQARNLSRQRQEIITQLLQGQSGLDSMVCRLARANIAGLAK